jgi:hypothetical protein
MEAISSDPSAKAVLHNRAKNPNTTEINRAIVNALAGPRPSVKRRIRAHAAYAAAKHATLTLTTNGALSPRDRAEILAAALRALDI